MTKAKKAVCTSCQICGEEKKSNLSCTLILDGGKNVETACFCVCDDCSGRFNEEIVDFYKPIINDL